MKRKFKIVFVAEDRGGFDAIFPVIKKIENLTDFSVGKILSGSAAEFADKDKIKYLKKADFKIKPDLILLGTSGSNLSIDKKIVQAAKELNIPTAGFVDFWSNYHMRFGKKGEFLPNYILAIDERMKKELEMYLIKVKKFANITITGSPRFDKVVYSNSGNSVVFYSQPLGGYELKTFRDVINSLKRFFPSKKVILKLHPREKSVSKFLKIIKESQLNIKIEKKLTVEQLNKKAGLVIGVDSMALFIACLMGKKTISYQPGKNKESDFLASNRYGWSVPAYTKEDLFIAVRDIFNNPLVKKKLLNQYIKNNSTQKVLDFINSKISN